MPSGVWASATSTLLINAIEGACSAVSASACFKRSAAGRIRLLWNGADTGSGKARLAPWLLSHSQALSTAARLPAITVWAGSLKFTASTTSPLSAANVWLTSRQPATTRCASMPRMAAIAPTPTGTASCIAWARRRTSGTACAKVSTPAATRAEYSPSECPATADGACPTSSIHTR